MDVQQQQWRRVLLLRGLFRPGAGCEVLQAMALFPSALNNLIFSWKGRKAAAPSVPWLLNEPC